MTFDAQKVAFAQSIRDERRIWQQTMIPHMLVILVTALVFLSITIYGMYTTILVFREKADAEQLVKATSIYVGGSSSVLSIGFIGLLYRLTQLTREYMHGLKRFNYFIARTNAASSIAEYSAVLKEYYS